MEGLVYAGLVVLVPTAGVLAVVVVVLPGTVVGFLAVVVVVFGAVVVGAVSNAVNGVPSKSLTALGLANMP